MPENGASPVNTAFEKVIEKCSQVPRPGQGGTWITDKFAANFIHMHALEWPIALKFGKKMNSLAAPLV